MIKLIRNIALFLTISACSLVLVSQFSNFLPIDNSEISKITTHFNKEHIHKFDLTKMKCSPDNIGMPFEKLNFTNSVFSSFILLSLIILIILIINLMPARIFRFSKTHFLYAILIPPEFS